MNNIEIYNAPELISAPIISRDKNGMVSIICNSGDSDIYYTLDETEPTISSLKYSNSFNLEQGGIVKAIAAKKNHAKSEVAMREYDLAPIGWSVERVGAEAIDGDVNTYATIERGKDLVIDLGKTYEISGFSYTPVAGTDSPNIYRYNFYVGDEGRSWTKVKENEIFGNIKNNPVEQRVLFGYLMEGRFIKIEPIESTTGNEKYLVAGLGVITR